MPSKLEFELCAKMARSAFFTIFLILFLALNSVEYAVVAAFDSDIEVSVVRNFDEYLEENRGVKHLQTLIEEPIIIESLLPQVNITYKIGKRISGKIYSSDFKSVLFFFMFNIYSISGDSLQTYESMGYKWNFIQNFNLSLAYPKSGNGAVVTYVEVEVSQV